MLELLPKTIPPLPILLDDCGAPSAKKLAKALGVTERTVSRWLARGHAPRAAMLAIFWVTRWGQSNVHCKAHNDAVLYAGYVSCLTAEVAKLRRQLELVGQLGDFGAANDPVPGVSGPGPSAPTLTFPPIQFPDRGPGSPIEEPQFSRRVTAS
jgi:hypothetical protein